jgi:cystathionine beta-lyase/cystathionine gamma-synthase
LKADVDFNLTVRLSIGVESFEDLKQDLIHGMNKVLAKERGRTLKL